MVSLFTHTSILESSIRQTTMYLYAHNNLFPSHFSISLVNVYFEYTIHILGRGRGVSLMFGRGMELIHLVFLLFILSELKKRNREQLRSSLFIDSLKLHLQNVIQKWMCVCVFVLWAVCVFFFNSLFSKWNTIFLVNKAFEWW